jgi:AcrR family transcriptional regulator
MANTSQPAERKRPYRSQARQRQAEETRRRILAATRELFATGGYAGTTVEAIAELAGVSPKTVSAVFGSKRTILAAVVNPGAFGPDVRQLIEELRATPEPSRRVALVARITRQAYEPLVPELELLRTAPGVAPELADLARDIEERRRENQSRLVAFLEEHGALRRGLQVEEATDALWALTSYDLYRKLVVEQGWAPERYEIWLAQLLIEHLLQPAEE